ncbi:hypothetical protein CBL_00279 [Carabus blaptoides fortunei]
MRSLLPLPSHHNASDPNATTADADNPWNCTRIAAAASVPPLPPCAHLRRGRKPKPEPLKTFLFNSRIAHGPQLLLMSTAATTAAASRETLLHKSRLPFRIQQQQAGTDLIVPTAFTAGGFRPSFVKRARHDFHLKDDRLTCLKAGCTTAASSRQIENTLTGLLARQKNVIRKEEKTNHNIITRRYTSRDRNIPQSAAVYGVYNMIDEAARDHVSISFLCTVLCFYDEMKAIVRDCGCVDEVNVQVRRYTHE